MGPHYHSNTEKHVTPTNSDIDPWDLLREARNSVATLVGEYMVQGLKSTALRHASIRDRIDSAIAQHDSGKNKNWGVWGKYEQHVINNRHVSVYETFDRAWYWRCDFRSGFESTKELAKQKAEFVAHNYEVTE